MSPESTGRFFFSVVVFGSPAFNLLTVDSLFFSTPCRAVANLYNDSNTLTTIDLAKGGNGVYSAIDLQQSFNLSSSINSATQGKLF